MPPVLQITLFSEPAFTLCPNLHEGELLMQLCGIVPLCHNKLHIASSRSCCAAKWPSKQLYKKQSVLTTVQRKTHLHGMLG